jgi:radical SAM protein with 4Fe4S-binding SPASM domain
MLYALKHDTFVRRYEEIGYITNKLHFVDRVVDASGAIFISALSYIPRDISVIASNIAESFIGVDVEVLTQDIREFYLTLENDGLIISGENMKEITAKDIRFSYSNIKNLETRYSFSPRSNRKTSQQYLSDHFRKHPHITSLHIELTNRCNERCLHCYIPHQYKNTDMDKKLFTSVIDQCGDMNVISLTLSGGEPMLHPYFVDYLRIIKKHDFSFAILSNLTMLNNNIVEELKDSHVSHLQVSLYSMISEIHDSITTIKGSYAKTMASIELLINNNIPVELSCPIMKQNKDSYVEVLKFAQKKKLRSVADFIMMARSDHSIDNLNNRLSLSESEKVVADIVNNDIIYQSELQKIYLNDFKNEDESEQAICGAGIDNLCMGSDGNCYPCAGWQSYVLGNTRETPLREIWENSPKVKYLRGLRKKDFPMCLKCPDKSFCAMCMVRNANENPDGDPLKINEHFCKVAALNRKIVMDWRKKLPEAQ